MECGVAGDGAGLEGDFLVARVVDYGLYPGEIVEVSEAFFGHFGCQPGSWGGHFGFVVSVGGILLFLVDPDGKLCEGVMKETVWCMYSARWEMVQVIGHTIHLIRQPKGGKRECEG